ncbi:MAG: Gfo/Idh/MocA family oxidoreductase [Acidobacteria bacterium]|nr:Gfo/Idh/MocA family oxidoreductase [Acidobacteriota bacterium]
MPRATGQVQFASGNLFRGDWNPQSWRFNGAIWRFLTAAAGSSLLEDGIHELDVIHWLVGARVARVYATGGNNVLKQRETIDHAVLAIDYENGVKVNFGFSLFAPNTGPNAREMTIIGTEGNLQPVANKIAWRKRSGGQPEMIDPSDSTPTAVGSKPVGKDEDNGTYRQLMAFVNSIRTGQPGFPDGEVGKEAIKISLLAEKSLRERRIVAWNELPS